MRQTPSDGPRTFQAFGVRFGIDAPVGDDELIDHLPPGSRRVSRRVTDPAFTIRPHAGGDDSWGGLYDVAVGSERLAFGQPLTDALRTLSAGLRQLLADGSPLHVFVHAGVVGVRDRAVVLPGRSEAGKSTLVAALLQAGAWYLSDEYAVLDACGLVHPYPQHIQLRVDGQERAVPPEELGARVALGALPVGAIVVTSFLRTTSRWRPRLATAAEGALLLLQHTPAARNRPCESLAAASTAARSALVLVGGRGDADATARILLRRLEAGWAGA